MRARDIRTLRQARERQRSNSSPAEDRYADAVLRAFDDLEHDDRRLQQDQRAEVERKARNTL